MTKVGEHITLDIIGTNKEYDPSFFENLIHKISKAAKVTILEISKYQFNLNEIQQRDTELLEGVERLSNNNIMVTLSNGWEVECKLLIGKDEIRLVQETERKRKKKIPESPLTDLLNSIVVSVSGHDDRETIKKAVAFMPAKDTRFLREAYRATIPNVDMSQSFTCSGCGHEENMEVPLSAEFFWPK